MEEDIKILEKWIKELLDEDKDAKLKLWLNDNKKIISFKAIENLIARYKELEVINKMQEYRISVIDERELIPKSKVKEKIKEINKEIDKCFISQNDKNFCFYECKENCSLNDTKKALQELLEES